MVHVARQAGAKGRVTHWGLIPSEGEFLSSLARVAKEKSLTQANCIAMLIPGEYHIMAVEAPNVPREELRSAIRWKVKDLLEYHVDDATIDVLEIPGDQAPDGKARLMYAVATRNDLVKKRIADFQEARLQLKVIDIPEMAQRNIASRFETADRSIALVSFREWGGLLTFTHQGELLLSRRLEVTSEQLAMPDHRAHYLERVTTDLQRSFENFERRFHRSPIAELLVAPLPDEEALTGHLAANLYLPVKAVQLEELLEFPSGHAPTVQEQSQYFHLFGAALREEVRAL